MSESVEVNEAGNGARRRRPAADRQMSEEPQIVALNEGEPLPEHESGSPEEALANAHRTIQERDRQIDDQRSALGRAERVAQRANADGAANRGAAIAAAVESATSAQVQAETQLRTARENGDIDEEIKASKALHSATFRLEQANSALQNVRGDPTSGAGGQQEQQQASGPTAASAAWIARHPQFNSDPSYKAALLAAHHDIVRDGMAADSPAYFRALDAASARLDGGNQSRNSGMDEPRGNQYSGAPPSRGNNAPNGGKTVRTLLGDVAMSKNGGKITYNVPVGLRETFEEGAKISQMSYAEYVHEQVKAAQEREAGGNGGLVVEEGRTYR